MRHLRELRDLSREEALQLVDAALELKRERKEGLDRPRLPGRVLGLLFEKPSMRTRVSFESAIAHLGGASIFMSGAEVGLGKRETVADFARIVSRYVDMLAVRTFSHAIIEELANASSVPVINALSDAAHPCQALADLCTLRELFGKLAGLKLVFVGDGNNVAKELAVAAAYSGIQFTLCGPRAYWFDDGFVAECNRLAEHRGRIGCESDAAIATRGADAVYTDVWASMGQEAETARRAADFEAYRVTAELLSHGNAGVRFMHCLPAHRGEEVDADVIDGPASAVVQQAENRLHAQKALILWLHDKARTSAS